MWQNYVHLKEGGGGGGQLARFWVGMCPGRTKMQTLNLGKTFHWNTKNVWKWHEFTDFLAFNAKILNITLFKGKMSNFFSFLLITKAKFSWFYLLFLGHIHTWSLMGVAPSPSEGVREESTTFYLLTTWWVCHGEFEFCRSEFELAVW